MFGFILVSVDKVHFSPICVFFGVVDWSCRRPGFAQRQIERMQPVCAGVPFKVEP